MKLRHDLRSGFNQSSHFKAYRQSTLHEIKLLRDARLKRASSNRHKDNKIREILLMIKSRFGEPLVWYMEKQPLQDSDAIR